MERIEAAKKLLRLNVNTHEQIAQVENLSLAKVQELAEEVATEKQQKEKE